MVEVVQHGLVRGVGLGAKVTGRLIVVGSFTRAGYGEVGGGFSHLCGWG